MSTDPSVLPERIASKIDVDSSGCWLWTASTWKGYGRIRINGEEYKAHRVVYHLLRDSTFPMRAGRSDHMDHLCRVPSCVNPDHLRPGTCRSNVIRGRRCQLATTASQFIGVVRVADGRWQAQCQVDRKSRYFGRSLSDETCAYYIDAALILLGEEPPNFAEGLVDRRPDRSEFQHVAGRVQRIGAQRLHTVPVERVSREARPGEVARIERRAS